EAAPLPTLPTTGDGAVLIDVIQRVCMPLVKGGNADQIAKAYGMKKSKQRYVATLGAKPYLIALEPQGGNKDVCEVTIEYAPGGEQPIVQALHTWAFLHQPQLTPYRSDIRPDPLNGNQKLITRSWEHVDAPHFGLVFVQQKKNDDTPVGKNFDRAKLLYQERQG
ncbi:MAG TPA: hypothetical protein VIO94_08010, partial [Phenylobacterium sp.]